MRTEVSVMIALAGTLLLTCFVTGSAQATSLPVLKSDANDVGIVTLVGRRGGSFGGGGRSLRGAGGRVNVGNVAGRRYYGGGVGRRVNVGNVGGRRYYGLVSAGVTPTKAITTIRIVVMATAGACPTLRPVTVVAVDGSITALKPPAAVTGGTATTCALADRL